MNDRIVNRDTAYESVLSTNKVLRNTYFLLSLTLVWSAVVAGFAMTMNLPHPGLILTLVGFYGLLFLTEKNRNSSLGLVFTFALTGFMGYTLGPILNMYVGAGLGHAIIPALGGTALTFFAGRCSQSWQQQWPRNQPAACQCCLWLSAVCLYCSHQQRFC